MAGGLVSFWILVKLCNVSFDIDWGLGMNDCWSDITHLLSQNCGQVLHHLNIYAEGQHEN